MNLYRSPYEAYPFLCDSSENFCCDFELLTDEIASRTGLLRAQVKNEELALKLNAMEGMDEVDYISRNY